uniref:60 kDa protein n=1 Tax=Yam virus 1 TaxID=3123105 RepID=A0AAU6NEJ9_9CLOS
MVGVYNSIGLRDLFTHFFGKSDVEQRISLLTNYLTNNYVKENRTVYKAIHFGKDFEFNSTFSIKNAQITFDVDDDKSHVKCLYVYLYRIEPDLLQKTAYKPESFLISSDWRKYLSPWTKYIDKNMNEYLNDNKKVGCLYTEEEIQEHYHGQPRNRLITLYRVCNSQGRLIPLDEFLKGEVRGFEISTGESDNVVGENISNNLLFLECVKVFKVYLGLVNSKSGMAKLEVNKKFFDVYFDSLNDSPDIQAVRTNPIALAKFIVDFEKLTINSNGFEENIKAIKTLDEEYKIFLRKIFKVNTHLDQDELFVKFPKDSVIDVLGNSISVSSYLRKIQLPPPLSNSSSLPKHIDSVVSKTIINYFRKYKLSDKTLILDALLFVFGKVTTNRQYWKADKKVSFAIDGTIINFIASDLTTKINCAVKDVDKDFNTNNIIRQWANLRGNRAMLLFKLTDFKPGLFSTIPKILPYMRFDFFKMLSMDRLTEEELKSFYTLRRMTEWKSNNTLSDQDQLERWICPN